jgi:hypothetical protein
MEYWKNNYLANEQKNVIISSVQSMKTCKMARTRRNLEGMHRGAYRFPHTFNEIRQLDKILHEEDLEYFSVSGINRMRAREHNLPTAWDDNVVSCRNDKNSSTKK